MNSSIFRMRDLLCALLLLVLLAPLIVIAALLTWWAVGRPIVFKQERAGLHGQPFRLFKFRTMTDNKDDSGDLLPDQVRTPWLCRVMRSLSLDELPQLINVIKGDMSLVGPRPLFVRYIERYSRKQRRRLDVPPGITGWAQINGRNAIEWNKKFELDLWYVDHKSFALDAKILMLTALKVFRREGVMGQDGGFVEEFKGSGHR